MLNLIIPIAGALALNERGARRFVAAGAVFISMGAVIVTFSRAGFLALAAIFVMFMLVLVRRKSGAIAFGMLLVALCVPPLMPKGYADRLSTITEHGRGQDRIGAGTLQGSRTGAGPRGAQPGHRRRHGPGHDRAQPGPRAATWRSVHNVYLQYAVDLGMPGFLLFAWLHLLCFRSAWAVEKRARKDPALQELGPLAAGIQVSLVAFLVAAMFHPIAYQFYFFAIAGLAVALKNTCRAELPRTRVTVEQS